MNKMNNCLKFIGTGSAFNVNAGNTSAYIKKNNTLLLIDCGESVFKDIINLDLLNDVKNIYILITHFHSDHVGSLGSLIYYCYYKKHIIPYIFGYNFEEFALKHGILKNKLYKTFKIGNMCTDDIPELNISNITAIKTEHCKLIEKSKNYINDELVSSSTKNLFPCFSYLIEFMDESLIYYSGDSCEFNQNILNDYLLDEYEDCIVFQDTSLNDFEGNVHLSLKKLEEAVPQNLRHKIYCMHLDNDILKTEAEKLGFNVVKSNTRNSYNDLLELINIIECSNSKEIINSNKYQEIIKKYNLK